MSCPARRARGSGTDTCGGGMRTWQGGGGLHWEAACTGVCVKASSSPGRPWVSKQSWWTSRQTGQR
eukprot:9429192-Pyramimonas_sp.AAC.2